LSETHDGKSTDALAQKMLNMIDDEGSAVLVNYVFCAMGVDSQGKRAIFTASSDNIGITDELGLVNYVRNRINAKQLAFDIEEFRGDI
jgi:hypothetical protein